MRNIKKDTAVYILFDDLNISNALASLVLSHGCTAKEIDRLPLLKTSDRLITESQYANQLNTLQLEQTLVVGNQKNSFPLELTRPLTEEKIERALEKLLLK
jgi:hypothetical protein